jgi:nucleoside phosphorylase
MDTKKINLFVFDSKENFDKSKQFLGEKGSSFKDIICIENSSELNKYFETNLLNEDEYVYLVIHVFAFDKISGIKKYRTSGIREKYPNLGNMFISDGVETEIKHLMVEENIPHGQVFKYHEVYSNLKDDKFKVYTKKQIIEFSKLPASQPQSFEPNIQNYPQIKYAVITDLFKDEFEELQKIFDFPEEKQIKTDKKVFYRGYLKTDKSIEIVAAVPNSTGMLDSSIIATLLLEYFRPQYLLMSGVCGASSEFSFGDIIVAKQVFTFQKGKISDIKRKVETGESVKIDLFDSNKEIVDYNHLFDNDGNQVSISIEKFEVEHDTIIPLDTAIEDSLNPKLDSIKNKINDIIRREGFFAQNKEIKVVVEPMACSTMVINKEGYFEDTIKAVHRKTAAVEMESYGVARACQFANNGKTKSLIFKSVMDNTVNKSDVVGSIDWKKFAAFTSAQFMKHLFEEKVI